ncbi:MAG TPA: MlaD family protein [Solirubrobacterales bacterium]|nr:MlaD family protein [Solirubrobacterales bacterium]
MAANPSGEDSSSAQGRGTSPARITALAALAIAVLVLGYVIFFSGNGEHKYNLLFQNASQLVPDNQVLIGGQPVGSVDSIELTDDNLAKVVVSVSQELHEGTTATIRATSLSGVANHYVSISPGPNSNPSLDEGGTLGLASTTTPVDIDQFFNTFPAPVRRSLAEFIKGNAETYAGAGKTANRTFKYLGVGFNRAGAFAHDLNADERLFSRFLVSSSKLGTAVSERSNELASAIGNASDAFGAIASQNVALSQSLKLLPPTFRQANTTFVNLRAALDDVEPLIETSRTATKELAPFLGELRPVLSKAVPVFKNLRLTVDRKGFANDAAELLAALPTVQQRASKAFPHSEDAITAFQPNLNFIRAYTPDLFNGFARLGQVSAPYDGNGHYVRTSFSGLNLFEYNSSSRALEPIKPSEQYGAFGSEANAKRPCPGGASQPTADGSSPFVEPPHSGAGVTTSDCNPADAPPGP